MGGLLRDRRPRHPRFSPFAEAPSAIASFRMSPIGVRSLFLGDILFDQSEEVIIEIRILNRLPSHDAENFGGTGGHGYRCGPDSGARRLLHFLQLAVLSTGGNEDDARSVAVVRARSLQS